MRENNLMALALLGVLIGASGLGFGVYSTMQVQTGAINGEDGDDGDDGSAGIDGKDAPVKGIVVQALLNSTSEESDRDPTSPYTLLSINISVSENSDILCFGTISLILFCTYIGFLPYQSGSAIIRLLLDKSIDIANETLLTTNNETFELTVHTIQGYFEGLSEGYHIIEFQYWIHPGDLSTTDLGVNGLNSQSVLTVMEIDKSN